MIRQPLRRDRNEAAEIFEPDSTRSHGSNGFFTLIGVRFTRKS